MRLSVIAIATTLIASQADAADVIIPAGKDYVIERSDRASRVVTRRHRHRGYIWKHIGMPCVLTPDEIVRRDWNGPQCRWVDNIILP